MTSFNMDGFGNYTDTTNVALKDITTGDSFKSFKGNSFSGQTGNSVSNQTGNKDAWQHGYCKLRSAGGREGLRADSRGKVGLDLHGQTQCS